MEPKRMEELSAWLDGEPGAGDTATLVQDDRELARAAQDLRLLGQVLREPDPLPGDFAARTAAAILRAPSPSRWLRGFGRRSSTAAVSILLQRAAGTSFRERFWPFLMALLFGLPALALALTAPDHLPFYSGAVYGLGALAVAAYVVMNDVARFAGLQEGRATDEVLSTGLRAEAFVDGFAWHSLGVVARILWPLVPLAFVVAGDLRQALALVLVWLPAVLVVTGLASFATQGRMLGAFGVLGLLGAWWSQSAGSWLPLALTGAVLTAVGLAGRARAARSLRSCAPQAPRRRGRNPWVRPWGDNPVVVRECQRLSAWIPAGLAGLIAWRALGLLPVLGTALVVLGTELSPLRFWMGLAGVGGVLFLQAGLKTLGAVLGERERGTFESLVESGLEPGRFFSGWIQAALASLAGPLVALMVLAGFLAGAAPEAIFNGSLPAVVALGALGWAAVAAAAWLGIYSGLQISATSTSRWQASGRLLGLGLRGCVLWLALWGLLAAATQWLVLARLIDAGSFAWETFVQGVLPVASLGLVCAFSLPRARRSAAASLGAAWGMEPPGPSSTGSPRDRLAQLLVGTPVVAVAAAVALHAGLFFVSLTRLSLTLEMELSLNLLLGLAVGLFAGWVVAAQVFGLTNLLLERSPRRLVPVALAGLLCGGLAGLLGGLFPTAARNLLWFDFRGAEWSSLYGPVETGWEYLGALSGLTLGTALALAGGVLAGKPSGQPRTPASRLVRAVGWLMLAALFLGALFGSFVAVAFKVEVERPALAAQVLDQVKARLEGERRIPDQLNGFAPLRQMLVGRLGGDVTRPLELGGRAVGTLEDNEKELRLNRTAVEEEAARFEAFLPRLREALARPEFSTVGALGYGLEKRTPNYLVMRRLAQCLAVLGQLREAQGRPQEALSHYLVGLRWGSRMSGQGPLLCEMVAVAQTNIALEPLLRLLGDPRLSPQDHRRALDFLEAGVLHPDAFGKAMDMEFFLAVKFFDDVRAGRVGLELLGEPVGWLPGFYLDHERAVYTNLYLRHREDLYALRPGGRSLEIELGSYPLSGLLAQLVPNHTRAQTQFEATLTRLEAARLLAALGLYRHEHGEYPESLEDLSPLLGRPAVHYLDPAAGFRYQRVGSDFRLWSQSTRWLQVQNRNKGWQTWFHPVKVES